jgi:cold shock CspA family protein
VSGARATGPAGAGERVGRVERFDADEGLGVVVDEAGGAAYPFHCVEIADGTRLIDAGERVTFRVRPGLPGAWEAASIEPQRPPAPPR